MKIYFDYAQRGSLWKFIEQPPNYKWTLYFKLPSSDLTAADFIYIPHTTTIISLEDVVKIDKVEGTFYKVMSTSSSGACRIGWMHESSAQGLEPYIL